MATSIALDVAKQAELDKALAQADAHGENVDGEFSLIPTVHPTTGELGYLVQSALVPVKHPNLLICRHKKSGVVQFRFPTLQPFLGEPDQLGAQPSAIPGLTYSFLPAFHFGDALEKLEDWVVTKALSIVKQPVEAALEGIALVAESTLKPHPGFLDLSRGFETLATTEKLEGARNQRVLLFVHGIFSSIKGAFSALADDPQGKGPAIDELVKRYKDNVFGYDHWTISKTPLENALALLEAIPENSNWTVDLVCHSRGGLITRSLFADKLDPKVDIPELEKIVEGRLPKIAKVGNVIFVAAANQGSPLADGKNLTNFLNIVAALASLSSCMALDAVIAAVRTIVAAGASIPSIEQLAPGSDLISALNSSETAMGPDNIYGARANFTSAGSVFLKAGVLLDKILMPIPNDVVVPYDGVASPDPSIVEARLQDYGTDVAAQNKVWHTQFFSQPEIHQLLRDHLPGV